MFIGLLGGSFNPIHNGHLHIAKYVYNRIHLDRIIFVPTGDPPHKPSASLAPAHHRLEMVKQAIAPFPYCTISDHEIQSTAVSYSVDTVTHFKKECPEGTELGFILGLDAFLDFCSWRKVDHLLTLCHFIVCSRPGVSFTQLQSLPFLPVITPQAFQNLDEQNTTRLDIILPSGKTIYLLSIPPCEISASTIRERLALGSSVSHWLPPTVESYIIQQQLYQWPV
ncbi:MAG: putative nicotinate-nucleotide adenylyltransferase [Nitrospirales bacterium]|nr:MAG: putative nicotinate-nucleotide adenylyltransferase [Nitrospirales bacterium]